MPATRLHSAIAILIAALLWLTIDVALAGAAEKPVAALLTDAGVRDSGVADLMFADLATHEKLELVERDRLSDVLEELDLASAQQPGEVRGRLKLGKLLKADLLLIVRRVEKPEPHYQLVVAETKRGLRLSYDSRAASDDSAADTAALLQTAQSAIAKHGAEIHDVCAVPPFVSDDLGLAHHHLKGAFARVIEGALAQRRGLVFVEFAEAQAVARELALNGNGEKIAHRLPLYFLGNFRHANVDGEERIRLKLSLQRGNAVLAERTAELAPSAAIEFLRSEAMALAQEVQHEDADLIDAASEARLLAERSQAFHTTGEWPEAAALAEASLLLDPQQLEVRKNCIVAYTHQISAAGSRRTEKSFRAALEHYARGLQHVEVFLRDAKDLTPYKRGGARDFIGDLIGWSGQLALDFPHIKPEEDRARLEPLWRQVHQYDKQTSLHIFRTRARAGYGDELNFFYWVLGHVPKEKRMNFVFALSTEMADRPGAARRTEEFSLQGYNAEFLDNPPGEAYLQRLEKSPHEPLRQAAVSLRARMVDRRKATRIETRVLPGPAEIRQGQPLEIRPLELTIQRLSGDVETMGYFAGAFSVGPDVDFFWNPVFLGVMSKPRRVREIWNRGKQEFALQNVSFDGRYVWASVYFPSRQERPYLLVIEPQSGKTWKITHKAGLPFQNPQDLGPLQSQLVHVCGFAPGKACVIGSFGRSWIAVVEFDPASAEKPHVELILEATSVADQDRPEQWLDASLAFRPTFVLCVPGDQGAKHNDARRPHILVGRDCDIYETRFWPLVVDPTRSSVKVTAHRLPNAFDEHSAPWVFDVDAQAVWMVGFDSALRTDSSRTSLHLHRLPAPDFAPESAFVDAPPGRVVWHNGELLIAGKQWWRLNREEKESTLLGEVPWHFNPSVNPPVNVAKPEIQILGRDTPKLTGLAVTHHHGVLAWTTQNSGKYMLYAVEVPPRDGTAQPKAP